jgi:hypothetical protein
MELIAFCMNISRGMLYARRAQGIFDPNGDFSLKKLTLKCILNNKQLYCDLFSSQPPANLNPFTSIYVSGGMIPIFIYKSLPR